MRYILSVLLLPALLPAARGQENEAEKLFRAMEKKIRAATAVQIIFDIELREIEAKEESKDKVTKAKGVLLLTKDNKVRLKIIGVDPLDEDFAGRKMVSNGKQMKLGGTDNGVHSFDQAKPIPTPQYLHGLLSTTVSRIGVTSGSMILFFAPGPELTPVFLRPELAERKVLDADEWNMGAWDFKAGGPARVGGRDATMVSYRIGPKEDRNSIPVTLWIDAKTLLPLKSVTILRSWGGSHVTELYTEIKLDPKIDAAAFNLDGVKKLPELLPAADKKPPRPE